MLPTTIRTPPSPGDFTPLAEYQSQTPESFIGGKPVLHYHVEGAKAWIPKAQCGTLALFPADMSQKPSAPEGDSINGDVEELVEQSVDIFVNSETLTIFSNKVEAGVSIPYPSISIHAVKQIGPETAAQRAQAVWMQLEFSDGGDDDDDFNTIELTIIPPQTGSEENAAKQLYEAMASCSDLHPDPNDEDEDDEDEYDRIVFEGSNGHAAIEGFTGVMQGASDGSLPPPMPGSGGWITADNVHEYFDEDGNWIGQGQAAAGGLTGVASDGMPPAMPGSGGWITADNLHEHFDEAGNYIGSADTEELGQGAGRVRARDEVEEDNAAESRPAEDSENKRPRVGE
ncbi:hypothetical protein FZEAL_8141 [Fusarium zealandicum]|uniref:FPD1 n=1 Tax=Fusarium zealandicum TaxID=1053134 RepID=A0A8H4XHZ0_9HYPO|nr:hypothetical protein FZEAL_8141 [Fusarium zealandicum]